MIADASEFQAPPPEEMPAAAAPDLAAQRRIMSLVAAYVSKAVPRLPNFMATRATNFYEDTPLMQKAGDWSTPYQPLHLVGNSQVTVTYREGREVDDVAVKHGATPPAPGTQILEENSAPFWGSFS